MYKIRRFYNSYKKNIWTIIGGLAAIILVLQLLNNNAEKRQIEINKRNNEINSSSNTTIYNNTPIISSDENYDKEKADKKIEVLETFLEKCNNQNVEEAYELLSDYCKTEMFSNMQEFKKEYIDSFFKTKKTYNIQLWSSGECYIYKITMYDDVLETGSTEKRINTYYTVIEENGNYKINVNNFVKKEVLNKEFENEYLKIKVINKYSYMDYEEYQIQIINKTDKTILMDGHRNSKSVYLVDTRGNIESSKINEIPRSLLIVDSASVITRNIEFYKSYTEEVDSKQIVFSDILFGYKNQNNKQSYKSILKVEIDL